MATKEVVLEGGPPWGFRMHGDGAAGTPFRISRVNPGSRSAEGGLREGELVISISGVSAASLSTAEAHRLLREAGNRMQLTLAAREMPSPRASRKQPLPDPPAVASAGGAARPGPTETDGQPLPGPGLTRSRSLDRPGRPSAAPAAPTAPAAAAAVNGEAESTAAPSGGVTSSPLPPPSPKTLSRSPSLRRKGVWQPGQSAPVTSTSAKSEVKVKQEDGPLIKEAVWTPQSSPKSGRKQYRTINYDSNSLERKKTESPQPPTPPPPPSESFAWRAPEVPGRSSSVPIRTSVPVRTTGAVSSSDGPDRGGAVVPGRSSSLPRVESATVTLLREARQGHLPRGAQYLRHEDGLQYELPRQPRPPPVKEVDGVGPTTREGMPVALRSTVKGENQQDWYRRVYDNLHRQPQARSSYGLGGYASEPELNYEDDTPSRLQSTRRVDRYKGQPGRIEDYIPGKSALAEQEAAKAGNLPFSPPQDSFTQRVLDGYESDSTLVYHRAEPPRLTSGEQRSYYTQIQRGGEVPLTGLRKPAPERSSASAPRYQEAAVNIHYRSPVRWEEKEPLSEDELRRRQEDSMRRVYEEARRRKEERQAEDRESRRHGDHFTPSQKSPIQLDRYERLFDDVTDDRRAIFTATVLHDFRAQNNRELSLSRGETVKIRRKIDSNWYEGQKGTRVGILPVSYVQVNDPRDKAGDRRSSRPQVRARHRFAAQSPMELSLTKGDIVTVLRRVDDNWYEGRRGDSAGIFPISYVEPISAGQHRENGAPRQKPVGAPAAHGLLMDAGQRNGAVQPERGREQPERGREQPERGREQLRVDVQQTPLTYRVLFPYQHQNDDELDLEEGDLIHVLEQCPDGWYVGTNMRTGMFGTFPGNYTSRM